MALAYAALKRPTQAIAVAEQALQVARSRSDTELAEKIEAWLKSYRAAQAKGGDEGTSNGNRQVP